MARACVSLSRNTPSTNGSGDAYQSWNVDQATASRNSRRRATPAGLRPPVSDSATSCSSSAAPSDARGSRAALTTLLQPALLLVVALRALVQRRRDAVLHHAGRIEVGKGRMESLELVEVVEDGLHHAIDDRVRRLAGGHEGRQHAVGRNGLRVAAIHPARNAGL